MLGCYKCDRLCFLLKDRKQRLSLPDYMRLWEYVFLERLPLTAVGKVDYKVLEEMN